MPDSPTAQLLAELIRCDSTNPDLVPGGAGEAAVADLVAGRLEAAGLAVELVEVAPGRPNVIGRLPGSGGGRTLLLCSHTDVVGADAALFEPRIEGGRMLGRGAIDMKSGLAASIVAVEQLAAAAEPLAGDVIVAGVIDEEYGSLGAVDLATRVGADAAILPEQSDLQLITAHGGFAWFELTSIGFEAAGIDVDRGIDSIALLAPVLERISALDRELAAGPRTSYGRPSIHASTIAGGSQYPAFPARTVLGIERCTVAGETYAGATAEIEAMIAAAKDADPRFDAELELVIGRDPVELGADEPIVALLDAVVGERLGEPAIHRGDIGWMDSGILVEAGIPCVIFGPTGAGEHTDEEWVDLESIETCAAILAETARRFCVAPEQR